MPEELLSPIEIQRRHEEYMAVKLELFRLFMDKKSIDILRFIKDFQRNSPKEELTKEEITRYTDSAGILSRPVTLRIVQKLLDYKIILNEPRKPNAQSNLIINPDFDFKELVMDLIRSLVIEIRMNLQSFDIETRGVNTVLISELVEAIDKFSKREEIYTPKQMEQLEMNMQKKIVNQTKKRLFGSVRKARNQTGIK